MRQQKDRKEPRAEEPRGEATGNLASVSRRRRPPRHYPEVLTGSVKKTFSDASPRIQRRRPPGQELKGRVWKSETSTAAHHVQRGQRSLLAANP